MVVVAVTSDVSEMDMSCEKGDDTCKEGLGRLRMGCHGSVTTLEGC